MPLVIGIALVEGAHIMVKLALRKNMYVIK